MSIKKWEDHWVFITQFREIFLITFSSWCVKLRLFWYSFNNKIDHLFSHLTRNNQISNEAFEVQAWVINFCSNMFSLSIVLIFNDQGSIWNSIEMRSLRREESIHWWSTFLSIVYRSIFVIRQLRSSISEMIFLIKKKTLDNEFGNQLAIKTQRNCDDSYVWFGFVESIWSWM